MRESGKCHYVKTAPMSTFCWWPLRKSESSYQRPSLVWFGANSNPYICLRSQMQIRQHTLISPPVAPDPNRSQFSNISYVSLLDWQSVTHQNVQNWQPLMSSMWQNSWFMPNSWSDTIGGIYSEVTNVMTKMAIQKGIFFYFYIIYC